MLPPPLKKKKITLNIANTSQSLEIIQIRWYSQVKHWQHYTSPVYNPFRTHLKALLCVQAKRVSMAKNITGWIFSVKNEVQIKGWSKLGISNMAKKNNNSMAKKKMAYHNHVTIWYVSLTFWVPNNKTDP